ncbi:hypothetical protein PUN28_020394 [Cardiocondyla obscurior]|uniref:Uncharacterized protein n=1 Tax=Cardiocondyla obscurior TaxID=286306 RepID=A0AAW2E6V9_9HYME
MVRFSKFLFRFSSISSLEKVEQDRTLKMVTWASADVTAMICCQIFKHFFVFVNILASGESKTLKMVTWASADVTAR